MCGIVGLLLRMYCGSWCDASVVASALAFHPPTPMYAIKWNEGKKIFEFIFKDPYLIEMYCPNSAAGLVKDSTLSVHMIDIIDTPRCCGVKINNNKLPVILFRSPNAKYTLLYSHGNAADLGSMYGLLKYLALNLNCNVIGYDYSGYGAAMMDVNNSGKAQQATEKQVYRDIESVYKWALESKLVTDPSRELVVYGQSVGSGPSIYLSTKYQVAGIVLHSPIMSGLRVITPSRWLSCWDIFPNIEKITSIRCPVYIIHGRDDDVVAVTHGEALLDAVPVKYRAPAWFVPYRNHNDVLNDNEVEYISRLKSFYDIIVKHLIERNKEAESSRNPNSKAANIDNAHSVVISKE